jgi:hypothetical protein
MSAGFTPSTAIAITNKTTLKPRMTSPTRSTSPRRLMSNAAISVPSSTAPPES